MHHNQANKRRHVLSVLVVQGVEEPLPIAAHAPDRELPPLGLAQNLLVHIEPQQSA